MTTYDLSTIGKGQIRFTVDSGERLMFTRNVRMNPACSEANVAGLTAQLGWRTLWTSSLPESDLGDYILSEYRSVGVDMHTMVRKPGGRTALYFMEPGAGPMPANVIYDREWTPFRSTGIDEYDWDTMLDTEVVFLTGVTASLTDTTAQVVRYAADEAVRRGAEVILDVNFRRKLWSGERARKVLEPHRRARQRAVLLDRRRQQGLRHRRNAPGSDRQAHEALRQPIRRVDRPHERTIPAWSRRLHRLRDHSGAGHRQARRGRCVHRGDDSRIPVGRHRLGRAVGQARLRIRHHPYGRSDAHTDRGATHPPRNRH
ncbi:MAG: PfkB family carbohydrate kinase [Bifidobacterium tibiigranuli]|nr:PfkB family carbohydrate kinase [Bifidobacterium tibiigranuli]MCI1790761.1 PfkB family carbohydrate kinase [Bifidobacterium tibiigranuli]